MTVCLPWGPSNTIPLDMPADWQLASIHNPDLSNPIENYSEALEAAITQARLADGLRPGSRVAIVVDDASRWTPVREALPPILETLREAGVRPEDITISVAVGRHRAMDAAALRQRLGDDVAIRYQCFSPPVDDANVYVDLGVSPEKIPVRVFHRVATADLRVLIGSVLPHLQAGFGGGWKLIFPGTSHRSTLVALHRCGLDGDTSRLLGSDAASNPMRCAVRSAARLLTGPTISISHLLGPPGAVLRVCAGEPDQVQDILAAEARRRFQAPPAEPADIVIAGNYPWPGDPMQSFKVLLQHRPACRTGGVLAGFFHSDPEEFDRSVPLPPLRAAAATGWVGALMVKRGLAAGSSLASALGLPSAFMVRWARELVVDRTVLLYAPALHAALGPTLGPVRIFADQATLWAAASRAVHRSSATPTVRVFPAGGLSYCRGGEVTTNARAPFLPDPT